MLSPIFLPNARMATMIRRKPDKHYRLSHARISASLYAMPRYRSLGQARRRHGQAILDGHGHFECTGPAIKRTAAKHPCYLSAPTVWHLADTAKAIGAQTGYQARSQINYPIELQRPVQQCIDRVERDHAKDYEAAQAACRKSSVCDDPVRATHTCFKMRAHRHGNQSSAAQDRDNAKRSLNVAPHFVNAIPAQQISRFTSQMFFKSGQAERCKQHKQQSENTPPQRLPVQTFQTLSGEECVGAETSGQQIYSGGKQAKKALGSRHTCPSYPCFFGVVHIISDHASLIKRLTPRIGPLPNGPALPIMMWQRSRKVVADLRSIPAPPMRKYISIQGVLVS